MNPQKMQLAGTLLAYATASDPYPQSPSNAVVQAWADILDDEISLNDGRQAIIQFRRRFPGMRLEAGHVNREAKLIREKREIRTKKRYFNDEYVEIEKSIQDSKKKYPGLTMRQIAKKCISGENGHGGMSGAECQPQTCSKNAILPTTDSPKPPNV